MISLTGIACLLVGIVTLP